MSIIEEIKRDVRHDDDCDALPFVSITGTAYTEHPADDARCNCSRRRKIAWLERLENPTETMIQAARATRHKTLRGQLIARFKASIKAAEEDLP